LRRIQWKHFQKPQGLFLTIISLSREMTGAPWRGIVALWTVKPRTPEPQGTADA
jgi:hypothetical protein